MFLLILFIIVNCVHCQSLYIFRAQMLMKSRLQGAQKGHGLLKKKADALQMRFRMILGKIIEVWLIFLSLILFLYCTLSIIFCYLVLI